MTRQRPWLRRLIRMFLLSAMTVSFAPAALGLTVLVLMVPVALGETSGDQVARREQAEARRGCSASRLRCVQLKRANEVVAAGYLVDVSDTRIALFDTASRRARVVPLEDLEIVAAEALP